MRKKLIVVALVLVALMTTAVVWVGVGSPLPGFGPWKYIGSANSDRYHARTCSWAKHIRTESRVFFSSPQQAKAEGYRPCPICLGGPES